MPLSPHARSSPTQLLHRFNNRPKADTVGCKTLTPGLFSGTLDIDVTDLIFDGELSVQLTISLGANANSNVDFKSRQNPDTANRPTLVYEVFDQCECKLLGKSKWMPFINCSLSRLQSTLREFVQTMSCATICPSAIAHAKPTSNAFVYKHPTSIAASASVGVVLNCASTQEVCSDNNNITIQLPAHTISSDNDGPRVSITSAGLVSGSSVDANLEQTFTFSMTELSTITLEDLELTNCGRSRLQGSGIHYEVFSIHNHLFDVTHHFMLSIIPSLFAWQTQSALLWA